MDVDQRKAQFSVAFAHAVASAAGYDIGTPRVDVDSVDITFSSTGKSGLPRRPKIDAQLKCSSQDILKADGVHFPLSIKNYDDLRDPDLISPRILIVLMVPEDIAQWLQVTDAQSTLRQCAYWTTLCGKPSTTNDTSVTVTVPRSQIFNPAALHDLMDAANKGGAS